MGFLKHLILVAIIGVNTSECFFPGFWIPLPNLTLRPPTGGSTIPLTASAATCCNYECATGACTPGTGSAAPTCASGAATACTMGTLTATCTAATPAITCGTAACGAATQKCAPRL